MTTLPHSIASDEATNQRKRRYEENRRYYAGEHLVSRRRRGVVIKPTPRNLSALFVDTVSDHMGHARVSFGDGPAADAFDKYLATTLAAEDSEQLDYDTEIGCAVDGDAAWKVTWDDQLGRVRIANVAPETLFATFRPDDPREVEMVAQRYKFRASDSPVLFGDQLANITRDGWITEEWTRDVWRVWLDQAVAFEQPNPYGFVPYIVFPNVRRPHEFWGTGDPERIRALQDRYDYAATDADDLMSLMGQVVVLEGVDNAGQLTWRPGAMWLLPPEAKAYVLDLLGSGGMQQRLDYLDQLKRSIHDEARVPVSALGSTSRNLSGVALQTELGPLVRLVARKRLSRSAALRRRAQYVLALGAMFGGEPELPPDLLPTVSWSEAIPSDRADELANAKAEFDLGRDPEAVLRSIGVDDPATELAAHLAWQARGLSTGAQPNGEPGRERDDDRRDDVD